MWLIWVLLCPSGRQRGVPEPEGVLVKRRRDGEREDLRGRSGRQRPLRKEAVFIGDRPVVSAFQCLLVEAHGDPMKWVVIQFPFRR